MGCEEALGNGTSQQRDEPNPKKHDEDCQDSPSTRTGEDVVSTHGRRGRACPPHAVPERDMNPIVIVLEGVKCCTAAEDGQYYEDRTETEAVQTKDAAR